MKIIFVTDNTQYVQISIFVQSWKFYTTLVCNICTILHCTPPNLQSTLPKSVSGLQAGKDGEEFTTKNLSLIYWFSSWFGLVVAMSMCTSVFNCFQGLSLALRSHDHIPASHWLTPPLGFSRGFPRVCPGFSRGFPRFFPGFSQGFPGVFLFSRNFFLCFFFTQFPFLITKPLQNCNGPTIRIGWEILCIPYAGFSLVVLFIIFSFVMAC